MLLKMTLLYQLTWFLVVYIDTLNAGDGGHHWDYRGLGPEIWKYLYPECGAKSQSPIDIKTECTTYESFTPFQFSPDHNLSQTFILTNNGHTVAGEQANKLNFTLTLSEGGLNETFYFKNFHLHWGENFLSGSEHQL